MFQHFYEAKMNEFFGGENSQGSKSIGGGVLRNIRVLDGVADISDVCRYAKYVDVSVWLYTQVLFFRVLKSPTRISSLNFL